MANTDITYDELGQFRKKRKDYIYKQEYFISDTQYLDCLQPEKRECMNLLNEGKSVKDICILLSIKKQKIYRWKRELEYHGLLKNIESKNI